MGAGIRESGKAFLYFLAYAGMQVLVSAIMGVVFSLGMTREALSRGEELDIALLQQQLTEKLLANGGWLILISGALTLLIYWIVFLIRKKSYFEETAVKKVSAKNILFVILLGFCFSYVTGVLISVIPFPQAWVDSYAAKTGTMLGSPDAVTLLTTILMAPVVEEVVFRGLVYTRLKRVMAPLVAALITSLLFAVMHGAIIWGIYTFIFSMVLIWVFEKYQSLLGNIFVHFGFNLSGMLTGIWNPQSEVLIWVLFAVFLAGGVGMAYLVNRTGEEKERESYGQ